jgi:hypothetical protein
MKSPTLLRVATFIFAAAALFILGCSDNSVQTPRDDHFETYRNYKSLAERENLIYNLMLCYREHNLPRYEELLHPDFIWYNQHQDVSGGLPEFYTKSEDSLITRNMFLAAENIYSDPKLWIDKLELQIAQPGTWTPVAEINGTPRTDCWETTRDYYLVLVMTGGDVTYIANDKARFVVVPVDLNGNKIYKIIQCEDLPRLQ